MPPRTARVFVALLVVTVIVAGTAFTAAAGPTTAALAGSESPRLTQPDCSFPYTVQDATGTNVTVAERSERIVVLQPSAAQTVWELGAQDRVVGAPINDYTTYLEGIESRTDVLQADEFTVNQEAVVELDADVVLAPNVVPTPTVESLREANQTVYKFRFGNSLGYIANKTTRTGRLIGSCDAAASVNDEYWNRIEAVEERADDFESPRVLHFADNYTAGSGTFVDDLITTAGGVNVAAEHGVDGYGQINEEALVEWNPEVIVVATADGDVPDTAAYDSTFAVQHDQVVNVNGNYISQAGPRVVVALEAMVDAFAAARLEGEPTPTPAAATPTDAPSTTTPAGATDGDGGGFGVILAVGALAAAGLLARRR